MKIIKYLFLFIILLIQINILYSQSNQSKIQVTPITDQIYKIFLNDADLVYVNLVAFISDDGVLLVDSGLDNCALEVKKLLKDLGGEEIKYILNTHSDGDHILGNPILGKDAIIIAHENCREEMQNDNRYTNELLPTLTFKDELTIHFGSEVIHLISMPCHTNGDVIVHFKKANILYVGDIIFSYSFPTIHPEKKGNLDKLVQTYKDLQKMFPIETKVIVGHGEDITVANIAEYEKMTYETIEAVRKAMQKKSSIKKMKNDKVLAKWKSWESPLFEELNCYLWIQNIYDFYQNKYKKMEKFDESIGSYFGQKPPGKTPEIFAPGIINTIEQNHSCVTISPDGNEIYWSLFSYISGVRQERIWFTVMLDGSWMPPGVAPFSGNYRDGSPQFSHDGKRLYFTSMRPTVENDNTSDANIWYIEKEGTAWSISKPLDKPVNTEYQEWFPTIAKNGNIYFMFRKSSATPWDIYYSRFENGKYKNPEKLGNSVISPYVDAFPFIDPEEQFIIFYSERPGGYCEAGELYISFRKKDDTWSKAKNMGSQFNSTFSRFPGMSPDGRFFFFSNLKNGMEDIYWVDAKIIEDLKPDELK